MTSEVEKAQGAMVPIYEAIMEGAAVFRENSKMNADVTEIMEKTALGPAIRAAIAAYVSHMEGMGFKMMPREATGKMVGEALGVYNGAGQSEPDEVWRAMFDAYPGTE